MTGPRAWLERPIADDDRRPAFATAAGALLVAAIALSLAADPPHQPPDDPSGRPPATRPDDRATRPAHPVAPVALDVARRFLGGYLAFLHGRGRARDIRDISDGLRRRLISQRVRVSPAMRAQRPRVGRLTGQGLDDGWLVTAEIATGSVSFPVAVVVADRPSGPVVARLVED